MAVKDVHPELEKMFQRIAEIHEPTLGPVSERFVNGAVMLARELETQFDDTLIALKARQLVYERYPRVSQTMRDVIADEIICLIVRRQEQRRH